MNNSPLLEERKFYPPKNLVFLKLSSHLEHTQTQEFKQLFTKEFDDGNFCLIINFSSVNFIFSAHVGILWAALKHARTKNGDIRISEVTEAVKNSFYSLNLHKSIRFYASDEQAILSFEQHIDLQPR